MKQAIFIRESPLEKRLSVPGYSMRVDSDHEHRLKQAPHWHLCFLGKVIARINKWGCWTSWPPVSKAIRLEAEALTRDNLSSIATACGQGEHDYPTSYTH